MRPLPQPKADIELAPTPTSRDKSPDSIDTDEIAESLLESYQDETGIMQHVSSHELPSTEKVANLVEQIRALLFPGFVGPSLARVTRTEMRETVRERLDELRNGLRKQLYRDLHHNLQRQRQAIIEDCPRCAAAAAEIAESFLLSLPELRARVALDVEAAYDGDPAAKDPDEVIFCYPGLYAVTAYRIANSLLFGGARLIPRIITELAHEKTGIDIHPGATIGDSFFIDHGSGVVIGETTVIGNRVRLYQGVTLGALSVPKRDRLEAGKRRHPTIEDDVIIYAGATILGGNTVIGTGSVIGGNCWVISSVPPHSQVTLSRCRTTDNRPDGDPTSTP